MCAFSQFYLSSERGLWWMDVFFLFYIYGSLYLISNGIDQTKVLLRQSTCHFLSGSFIGSSFHYLSGTLILFTHLDKVPFLLLNSWISSSVTLFFVFNSYIRAFWSVIFFYFILRRFFTSLWTPKVSLLS